MCKELAYYILNNQKLDWLKRKELWRADKIDFYLFFFVSMGNYLN